MPKLPKVIFIDWYQTLSTSLFWTDHPSALLTSQEFRNVTQFLFSEPNLVNLWMKGLTNAEQVVSTVAAVTKINVRSILLELEYSCKAMGLYDPTIPVVIQALRKQGIRVIVATDNMDTFERWTVPALKLTSMFDGVITSVSQGACKSEIQDGYSPFFGHYLGQNSIAGGEAILIDDEPIQAVTAALDIEFRLVREPGELVGILHSFLFS